MIKRPFQLTMAAALLGAAVGCSHTQETRSGAFRDEVPDEDGDVQVALADCPAAVQHTIRTHIGEATISEIERSPQNQYEVEAQAADGEIEFIVDADGTYLGPEPEDDDDDDVDVDIDDDRH